MNKREALKAMLDGKKVCCKKYCDGLYLYYCDNAGFIRHSDIGVEVVAKIEKYPSDDEWHIYEEKEEIPTVEVEYWLDDDGEVRMMKELPDYV